MLSHHARRSWEELQYPFSSIKSASDGELYAATLGRGVFRRSSAGDWQPWNAGMPGNTAVNRLQSEADSLYACTDQGLYRLRADRWEATSIAIPSYQYREQGGFRLAGTQYGLWGFDSGSGEWLQLSMRDTIVYDVLVTPHYLILGTEKGIALYDQYMNGWSEYQLGSAVTGLAVVGGRIIGVTERGCLTIGNQRGGFETVRFGNTFHYGLSHCDGAIYACSDRGLYRLGVSRGQILLVSVRLGTPVTDVELCGGQMHLATLYDGIQSVERPAFQ
jgi:ligand-binding sensor domain-containing protein